MHSATCKVCKVGSDSEQLPYQLFRSQSSKNKSVSFQHSSFSVRARVSEPMGGRGCPRATQPRRALGSPVSPEQTMSRRPTRHTPQRPRTHGSVQTQTELTHIHTHQMNETSTRQHKGLRLHTQSTQDRSTPHAHGTTTRRRNGTKSGPAVQRAQRNTIG